MSCRTRILLIAALTALAVQQTGGATNAAPDFPTLRAHPGQNIVIKLQAGLGKAVKGAFVDSSVDGVRVQRKDGAEVTVPWESVRKITPKRSWHEFLIGVATGTAVAALAVLSSEGDVGAGWSAGATGIGAGAGVAAAVVGGPIEGPLYRAPKQESPAEKGHADN